MNTYLKVGLAAAVVVLAAFIGYGLLGGSNVGGPGPEATASSEASAAEPSATPDLAGDLPAGPHALADGTLGGGAPVTVTISATGWYGEPNGGFILKNDGDPPDGAGMIVFGSDLYVYGDPCQWSTTLPDAPATTVDELVAALANQPSRNASEPVEITVAGYSGKMITLHVPDDAVFGECDRGQFRTFVQNPDPAVDSARPQQGPGQIDEMWIVDVDGLVTLMDTNYWPATSADVVDELHALISSATFN
jgi:hypothetical protein